jgi:hypothetical protein
MCQCVAYYALKGLKKCEELVSGEGTGTGEDSPRKQEQGGE